MMLTVDRVWKTYKIGALGGSDLVAVKDVSFTVARGQVMSVIGESGSGKTTIGRMVLGLIPITRGTMTFDDIDVGKLRRSGMRDYYRRVQGVFQDPFSSYNPIFKADHVFGSIREVYFRQVSNADWSAKIEAALEAVRLEPGQVLHKYPHQLSGGQLQRLLIARALLLDIQFLVADEVISMLDASTRIDVLNLLGDLKERGLGILFITHDLSLGNYIGDRTVILRHGVVVEMGDIQKVLGNPLHPYTRALVASVPQLHRKWGDVERELAARDARLTARCLYHGMYPGGAKDGATDGAPPLAEAESDHFVACFQLDEGRPCPDATAKAA